MHFGEIQAPVLSGEFGIDNSVVWPSLVVSTRIGINPRSIPMTSATRRDWSQRARRPLAEIFGLTLD